MHFVDRLFAAMQRAGNPVCVGIDPRPDELPAGFLERFAADCEGVPQALCRFGCDVIDVIAPIVPAVKFQSAFYEAYGPHGLAALNSCAAYVREHGLAVIIDGKRNDIGSTAEAYARGYLGKVPIGAAFESTWHADALTVNPYLGSDGVSPFIKVAAREKKGVFVLVRTSNSSAGEFQDLVSEGKPLYRHVADRLLQWALPHRGECGYSLVGAVVGATYPDQLAELRGALPGVPILVPGYGSQGATGHDVAGAFDSDGLGAIVNNSRGITFAYQRAAFRNRFSDRWQAAIEQATIEMIDDLAANTPAARLREAAQALR